MMQVSLSAIAGRQIQGLQVAGEPMELVRNLSLDLRPSMLDDLGLLPALTWCFNRYREDRPQNSPLCRAGLQGRGRGDKRPRNCRDGPGAQTDVLILDLMMPDRNGIQVIGDIKRMKVCRLASSRNAGAEDAKDRETTLTDREREILSLVARGLANKEIATLLSISIRTVEAHRSRIMRKLNIHSHTGLIHFAMRQNLLNLP